jgi:hypothetical protein
MFMTIGAAITAEPAVMNFLLVKFKSFSVIDSSFFV